MTTTLFAAVFDRLFRRTSRRRRKQVGQINDAVLNRARRAIRANELALAAAFVEECGDDAPDDPACLNVLGLIAEARDDWSEARRCWGKALRINPSYTPAYENLRRWMELFKWGVSRVPVTFGDEPESLLALRNRKYQ